MRAVRIAGFFALLFLISCDIFRQEAPCPELAGVYFTPFDAKVSSRKIDASSNNELFAFERVAFNEYAIQLEYAVQYHASAKRNKSSLFSSAYAFSCPQNGQNGSRVSIDELSIITLYDINDQHKKGDQVNDLFDFVEIGSRLPLSAYLSQNKRQIRDEIAMLHLMEKPQLSDTCAFKIILSLDNGKDYTCISTPVIFY